MTHVKHGRAPLRLVQLDTRAPAHTALNKEECSNVAKAEHERNAHSPLTETINGYRVAPGQLDSILSDLGPGGALVLKPSGAVVTVAARAPGLASRRFGPERGPRA